MTTWGSFESVKEIAQSGPGFLWTARPRNPVITGDTYVIKTTEGVVILGDPDRLERESSLFLEAANAQATLNAAGAHRWAHLHESGRTDLGAFYVTDLYLRNAQNLVTRNIRLDTRSLSTLVHAVVDGLIELRDTLGRPHGNLKPSNILIGGPDGPTINESPVVLTDPAPASALIRSDESSDLVALGRIIYELVTLRPVRGGIAVAMTEDWTRLGPAAPAWVNLTNTLLNVGHGRPAHSLDAVRAMIPSAASATPRRSKAAAFTLAAAALAAAAGGVYYYVAHRHDTPAVAPRPPMALSDLDGKWSDFVLDWQWYQPSQRAELARLIRDASGPDRTFPADVFAALADSDPLITPEAAAGAGRSLTLDELRSILPSSRRQSLTESVYEDWIDELSASVRAVETARTAMLGLLNVKRLTGYRGDWASRGWQRAVDRLDAAIDTSRKFDPATRESAILPKPVLLAEAAATAVDAHRVHDILARIDTLRDRAAPEGEPAFANFAQLVAREGAGLSAPPERVHATLAHTLIAIEAAMKRAITLHDDKDRDFASFRNSPAYATLAADPSLATLQAWNHALADDQYRALTAAERRPLDDQRAKLASEIESLAEKLERARRRAGAGEKFQPAFPPDRIRELLGALAAEIASAGKDLVLSQASRPQLEATFGALKTRIDAFDNRTMIPYAYAETPAELRPLAAETTFESPILQARWAASVEAVAATPANTDTFVSRTDFLIDKIKPTLLDIAAPDFLPLPEPAAGLDAEALRTLAAAQRDAALTRIAALPDTAFTDTVAARAAAEPFFRWKRDVEPRLAAAAQAASELNQVYLPGSPGTDPRATFRLATADSTLDAVFRPVRERLQAIDAIAEETSTDALLARLETTPPEFAAERLSAWTRLADLEWAPDSPQAGEALIGRASHAIINTAAIIARLPQDRHAAVMQAFHQARVELWKKHAAWTLAIADDAARATAFTAAWTLAAPFGVQAADADAISPIAGYNWRGLQTRDALAKIPATLTPDEQVSAIKNLVSPLDDHARSALLADRADVAPFLRVLKFGTDPKVGKTFSATDAGPIISPVRAEKLFEPNTNPATPANEPPKFQWGKTTWTVREDGDEVIYTWNLPSPPISIRFIPVIAGDGETFISVSEVPAKLIAEIFKAERIKADVGWDADPTQSLLVIPFAETDGRAGPRTWTSSEPQKFIEPIISRRPSPRDWFGWLASNPTLDAPPRTFKLLPDGASLSPPTFDMPMQQVTPEAAIVAALRLGCRLPTAEEWDAARLFSSRDRKTLANAPTPNLRDQSWKVLRDFYVGQIEAWNKDPAHVDNRIAAQYPSGGIFLADDLPANYDPSVDNEALPASDDAVFFRPVATDSPIFTDLVGNVAEFVLHDPAQFERLAFDCNPDDVFKLLSNEVKDPSYGELRVVGGSALSPPSGRLSYDVTIPQTVGRSARSGYSDVGFRLAIPKETATTGTPLHRANRAFATRFKILADPFAAGVATISTRQR